MTEDNEGRCKWWLQVIFFDDSKILKMPIEIGLALNSLKSVTENNVNTWIKHGL